MRFEDEAQPIIAREFVQRIADPLRLRRRLEDALPELLLFGQLPAVASSNGEGDEAIAARLWLSVGRACAERLPIFRPDVAIFRGLIDSTARRILDEIWMDAGKRWETLAKQMTFGATITVRLAAVTAAAYDALVAHDTPAEDAMRTVYDIAWAL